MKWKHCFERINALCVQSAVFIRAMETIQVTRFDKDVCGVYIMEYCSAMERWNLAICINWMHFSDLVKSEKTNTLSCHSYGT